MLGHSIVSQHFMEPVGSIPNSQELSTCPHPKSDQSSPYHPTLSLKDPSYYYPFTYVLVFLVVSFLLAFSPITYKRSSSSQSCYMPHPSIHPLLDYSNYTWRRVQIMKLLVMQFSPPSRHLITVSVQISSSAPCSQTRSVYVPLLMSDT
jgi:hypothetical protein